ncbi:MAG: type II toxin-antitoxin system VapC family toxin [Terriglobia bacterium]
MESSGAYRGREAVLIRFVLDASVALCWCFEDQSTRYSEAVFKRLEEGDAGRAPFIWPIEMAHAMLVAERRRKIKPAQTTAFLRELSEWPIEVDIDGVGRALEHILEVGRHYRLTAYDAAYLELAIHDGIPLATLDAELLKAAKSAGVEIA